MTCEKENVCFTFCLVYSGLSATSEDSLLTMLEVSFFSVKLQAMDVKLI